jgi:hypothetical protein
MSRLGWALRRFRRKAPRERRILFEAAVLVPTVHALQQGLPYRRWRDLLEGRSWPRSKRPERPSVDEISRAVEIARRYLPGVYKCLPAAYATHLLLLRYGHPSKVHYGVARDAQGKVEAHAWVDSNGRVVMGQLDDLARFVPFPFQAQADVK